jgi:hypothetical protein
MSLEPWDLIELNRPFDSIDAQRALSASTPRRDALGVASEPRVVNAVCQAIFRPYRRQRSANRSLTCVVPRPRPPHREGSPADAYP